MNLLSPSHTHVVILHGYSSSSLRDLRMGMGCLANAQPSTMFESKQSGKYTNIWWLGYILQR